MTSKDDDYAHLYMIFQDAEGFDWKLLSVEQMTMHASL